MHITYRTKQPPGFFLPKPKTKVPLGPEDFPPGTVVKDPLQDPASWILITAVTPHEVRLSNGNSLGLSTLSPHLACKESGLLRSLDGGKTWLPCYKEE